MATTTAPPVVPSAVQSGAPSIGGCKMFPDDSIFNTKVTGAPVHAKSSIYIQQFRSVAGPNPSAGASKSVWAGSRGGIPVNVGGGGRQLRTDGSYGLASGEFRTNMVGNPRLEGEPSGIGAWDKHVLTVDPGSCTLTEVIDYRYDWLRGWLVGGGAVFDLASNARALPVVRGAGYAEAANLPMANLIYRYPEVAAGVINHPIRFVSNAFSTSTTWPATASDGRDPSPNAMPMGSRLRLKADVDLSRLGPQARVVAKAMQTYGIIASDSTEPGWVFTGEGDDNWVDADLVTLATLDINQFDVVDVSSWMVSSDSFQARPR